MRMEIRCATATCDLLRMKKQSLKKSAGGRVGGVQVPLGAQHADAVGLV